MISMNNGFFEEEVRRAEYQLKCINETGVINKIEGMDYVESLIKHTLPNLLLEIKWLKRNGKLD
ncbi:hypothetical protein [Lysinibacillus fusiformis]|uniref:hypothetical protein n=1 Tax=Lysinibacillus fusiformis TaxID=28031 RepID=UPI00263A40BD|nr:hypothetical protein [Lysinibacillus fusiformis]MDC6267282.1 hypothetical protein [Lysinibacillus sphaericus]MDN4968284.1 hypothetical protein [Lysinibacillus fusiformis]MDN4968458.1 hypothetical protein [Lysinibacillus fusiformis]